MNLKKKKKGFTLIELMAVIAIIAILAAVLVPTVSGYIQRAKKTAIITQVRNVVSAIETYNATAAKKDQINPTTTKTDTVDNEQVTTTIDITLEDIRAKVGADLLEAKSINKLPKTTPYKVLDGINSDTNSIKDISIDEDGILSGYNSTKVEWTANSLDVFEN